LYGLLLYCGGQQRAAGEALSFAQNAAYLVGDLESFQLTRKLIDGFKLRNSSHQSQQPKTETGDVQPGPSAIAIIPSLDNVNAKANQYGVPPALFLRALLHRGILFADSIAIPPNVLTNSSVFINELLFGGNDHANSFYLGFLHPLLPESERAEGEELMLTKHRLENLRSGKITEEIAESQIQELDRYFESVGVNRRYMYYPSPEIASNYGKFMLRAVSERRATTKAHLLERWRHMRSYRSGSSSNTSQQYDERPAAEMVDSILETVKLFVENLKDPLNRSKLYNLAGLFATVLGHHEAIDEPLRDDIAPEIRQRLISGRTKMLQRPWISNALCHELFDVPYRGNVPVHLVMYSSSPRTLVFLEEDEISSWRFMASLLDDPESLQIDDTAVSIGESVQISGLLLGQASEHELRTTRDGLAQIRQKLAGKERLDKETQDAIVRKMKIFATASADVEDEPVTKIAALGSETREVLMQFLRQCVFLVRKSEAVDRMYEEPQFTLPGILALERN
jgi:hypothetical protein